MAYSPRRASATMVTVDEGCAVRIWDLTSGLYQEPNEGPEDSISAVAFKLDGSAFATAIEDHTILIWDAATSRPVKRLRGHRAPVTSVAYRADGTIVSGARDGTVSCGSRYPRNLRTRTPDQAQAVFSGFFGEVWSVACSLGEDSAAIAAAGGDGTILVWDVDSREQLARLESRGGPVYSMAYDPTGSLIAAACSDGTVKMGRSRHVRATAPAHGSYQRGCPLAGIQPGRGADRHLRIRRNDPGVGRANQPTHGRLGVRRPARPPPAATGRAQRQPECRRPDRNRSRRRDAGRIVTPRQGHQRAARDRPHRWSTGKSSLMRLVDARVGQLAAASANNRSATAFATSVCPIHFNAWHYSSSHLWASLARAMFQALSLPDGQERPVPTSLGFQRSCVPNWTGGERSLPNSRESASSWHGPGKGEQRRASQRLLASARFTAGLVRTFGAATREALGDVKTLLDRPARLARAGSRPRLRACLPPAAATARQRSGHRCHRGATAAMRQLRRMWRWRQQLLATKKNWPRN